MNKNKGKRTHRVGMNTKGDTNQPLMKMVDSRVRKILNTSTEIKYAVGSGYYTLGGTSNAILPTWLNLSPQLAQGVNQANRVGSEVEVKSYHLRFQVISTAGATADAPYIVTVWAGHTRQTPNTIPTQTDFNQLLIGTSSTPVPFTSTTIQDNQFPVNLDYWVIGYRKMFKSGSSDTASVASNGNNDFSLWLEGDIDLLPLIKKKLIYNDAVSNTPTNCGVFVWATITHYDGSSMGANIPSLAYCSELRFTDA